LIQKSACLDSFVSISNFTVPLRILFRQHRHYSDIGPHAAKRRANSIQNVSGLPQGPADLSPGRLMRQTACARRFPAGMIRDSTWEGFSMFDMRRREFITLLGGAATAWPLAARAQQAAMPVVGVLGGFSFAGGAATLAAFRQGLSDTGYIEHHNLGIEYRWAEGRYDRLPAMAAELVSRQVAAILTSPTAAALAAKAATATIPVVFLIAGDPVQIGLVASLNRPGGNVTGATFYVAQLVSRQLEMLHQLLPGAMTIGVLVNPNAPAANVEPQVRDLQTAANALGLRLRVVNAANERDAEGAFATLVGAPVDALLVTSDGIFSQQLRAPLVALAARYHLPVMYSHREFVEAGGLICYTSSVFDAGRQAGVYAGRILKGAKPADLPVTQPTKFELVINLKTAKALGLGVPDKLLALADEVIE
jgi:putative tryptophan/tyrosine transport system substrate-binding protein